MAKSPSRDALQGAPWGEVAIAPTQRAPYTLRMLPTRFAAPELSCGRSNDAKHGEETATRHDSREHSDVQERSEESPQRPTVRSDPSVQAVVPEAAFEQNPHSVSLIASSVDGDQDTATAQEEPLELELLEDEIQDNAPSQREPIERDVMQGNPEAVVGVQAADVSTAYQEKDAVYDVDTVDATNDELFMRIVLERALFEGFAPRRRMALDAIAHAFVAAGGVGVRDRLGVTKRLSILTLMLYERPHLLTSALCTMVLVFNELNCKASYAGQLGGAFQATLRTHAMTRVVAFPRNARPHFKNDNQLRKRAVEDERLMRLVVYYRVFETPQQDRPDMWMKIVEEFNATIEGPQRPSMLTGRMAALHRVRHARTVLLNPTHRYYAYLSPTLRAMLVESRIFESTSWRSTRAPQDDELFVWIVLAKRPFDSNGDAVTRTWKDIDNAFLRRCSGNTKMAYRGAKSHMVNVAKKITENPHCLTPVVRTLISEYLSQAAGKNRWEDHMLSILGAKPSTENTPCLDSATDNDEGDGNEIVRRTRERGENSIDASTAHVLPRYFSAVSLKTDADKQQGGATDRPPPLDGMTSDDHRESANPNKSLTHQGGTMEETSVISQTTPCEPTKVRPSEETESETVSGLERAYEPEGDSVPVPPVAGPLLLPSLDEQKSTPIPGSGSSLNAHKHSRSMSPSSVSEDASTNNSRRIVHDRDAGILRRLLELWPFWAHARCKASMWEMVAESTDLSPFQTGADVKEVVDWLKEVAQDPTHSQHGRLGNDLCALLKAYISVSDKDVALHSNGEDTGVSPTRQREKILEEFDSTEVMSGSSSANGRKRTASSTASEPDVELGAKRRRVLLSDPDGADEDAAIDETTEIAFQVALSVLRRDALSSTAFSYGYKLQSHINAVVDHFRTDPESLSPRLRELAAEYNALLPSVRNTARQNDPARQTAHTPPLAPNVETSHLANGVELQPRDQDPLGTLHGQPNAETSVTKLCELLTRLTEKVDAQLTSVSAIQSILTKTVETQQTQTTELLKAFEVERREFRAMLQDERDAHRREIQALLHTARESQRHESQAMLDAIDREQKDRRDDFMLMANLISRRSPPAPHIKPPEDIDFDSELREETDLCP